MIKGVTLNRYVEVILEYADYKRTSRQIGNFALVSRMREAVSTAENSEEAAWIWELLEQQLLNFDLAKFSQADILRGYVQQNPVFMDKIIKKIMCLPRSNLPSMIP